MSSHQVDGKGLGGKRNMSQKLERRDIWSPVLYQGDKTNKFQSESGEGESDYRAIYLILAIGQIAILTLFESGSEFESGSLGLTNHTYQPHRIGLICKNRAQLLNLTWTNTLHISVAKRPQVSDSKKTILSDSMQKSGSKEHRNYRASGSNTRLTTSDLVHTPANLTIGQSGARLSDSLTNAQ